MERDLGKRHCDARAHGEDNPRPSYRLGLGLLTDQLQPRTMTDARRQPYAQRDIAIFGEFERVADKIGQDLQATRPVRKGHNLFAVDRDLEDFSAAAVAN